jgi:hypothetical protein
MRTTAEQKSSRLQQSLASLLAINRATASSDAYTVTVMFRIFALLLLMGVVSTPTMARYDATSDCDPVRINGEWECDRPGPLITSRQITWFFIVVLAPIVFFSLLWGAMKESRMSDDEWQKRYPGRELWTRGKKSLGVGFYLGASYGFVGLGFFWLAFVAPEALKWLTGQ